jgi:glycosyltransferase involved in cell wall biosynthesis
LLEHLSKQELPSCEFEATVIDDGCPYHTKQVIKELTSIVPFELKYFHHSNHGLGYTQNRGIRKVAAPIILLLPDDIFLTPVAVSTHLEYHTINREQEVAVLGKVLQSTDLNQSVFT